MNEKYKESVKLSEKTLKDVDKWSDEDLPNRPEVVANLHSLMGNAYLELQNYGKAEEQHKLDYEIATQQYAEVGIGIVFETFGLGFWLLIYYTTQLMFCLEIHISNLVL